MHGIQKSDRGYVWGTTWHCLENYITQDEPVSNEQTRTVLNYNLEKRRLYRLDGSPTDVFEIIRTDTNDVLVNSCTETYTIANNLHLFNYIEEFVLSQDPNVKIESVGTLFSGAIAFVNLLLGKYHIKGDESETMNRLMYYNPLGRGSYRACSHNIRVVCWNTLNASEAQGIANKSLIKVPHTKNSVQKLSQAIADLMGIKVAFDNFELQLQELTRKPFTQDTIETTIKNAMFKQEISKNRVKKIRERVEGVIESTKDEYTGNTRDSRYVLLQSFTNMLDHTVSKKSDLAYAHWDGLVGIRSNAKSRILKELITLP